MGGAQAAFIGLSTLAMSAAANDRVAAARKNCADKLEARHSAASLSYPPREIYLRVFKHEAELEVWARAAAEPFRLVANYAFTANSGGPGPKRREGDRQIPEGFYVISVFNPLSKYHLSLGLNYPNASDRVFSDAQKPGGEIYLHGNAVSIGCVAVGDAAIEEVYVLALDAKARGQAAIPVHIFPARMDGPEWETFASQHPQWREFWENLQPGYERFERTKRIPQIRVDARGRYRVVR